MAGAGLDLVGRARRLLSNRIAIDRRPCGCAGCLGDVAEDCGRPYIGGRSKPRPYEETLLAAEEFNGDTVRDEHAQR